MTKLTAVELQREYDNRAKVADFAAVTQGWARDAATFRAGHATAELRVAYGPGSRQWMDIFWPASGQRGVVALFFHGGYWQAMDASSFSHLAAGLLGRGVAVAMPSYDLCPQVRLAEIVAQARAAVVFLHRRGVGQLLAMGHSAGGHLAACLLASDWAALGLPGNRIAGALAISGLFDLAPLIQTPINDALGLDAAEATRLSPVFWPRPAGPLHAVVGGAEGAEYARQSREMAAAWGGRWEAVAGENHFSVIAPLADPQSVLVRRALDLLGGA
ncbi:MAG: alpha/beta hydrolase [Acetobacteraceae bacterium]|nr:alpha/beta hydrolase [Acetobacteraceae bacterium]MSP29372.1 alpha/beta hydrolase [Acetobacteraceae bacterium]